MGSALRVGSKVLAFVRLGRPHFLLGGFVMHAVGLSAALYAGARPNLTAALWGQIVITATQWMVHYANDYFDLAADRANATPTHWSGGSRILTNGQLPPRIGLIAALILGLVAAGASVCLVRLAHTGRATLPLVGTALFLSWTYSAPPLRWHSRGLGELVSGVVVTLLTPTVGFYLQAGYVPFWLPLSLWPLFCLHLCFQFTLNFSDAAGDAAVGKRTLVVRYPRAALPMYLICAVSAYLALPLISLAGVPPLVIEAVLLPAPVAVWLAWRMTRRGGASAKDWNLTAFGQVALLILTAALQAGAYAWLAASRAAFTSGT